MNFAQIGFWGFNKSGSAPVLDGLSDIEVAYSTRRLLSTYTGSSVRVRRASDNTEQDIGFTADGDFDEASLNTFCSGTNGFVRTWYDQNIYGKNANQTTTSAQPKIYDSSTGILKRGGRPVLVFDATNDSMTVASVTASTYFSFYHVAKHNSSFFFHEQSTNSNTANGFYLHGSSAQSGNVNRSGVRNTVNISINWVGSIHLVVWMQHRALGLGRDNFEYYKNLTKQTTSASDPTANLATSSVTADLYINSRAGTSIFSSSEYNELVLFRFDHPEYRTDITNNAMGYYSIT